MVGPLAPYHALMLQVFRVPSSMSQWVDAAVLIRMGPGLQVSRFPAMPRAMLAMHLACHEGEACTIAHPATFHTLTTRPSAYTHAGGITALGLIVRPSAAACLLGPTFGAVTDQALPWSDIVGGAESARLMDQMERLDTDMACLRVLMMSFCRAMNAVSPARWQQHERLCDAVGRHGARAVDAVGIGPRQLERRCLSMLGVSPKRFERLERFHRALSAVMTQDTAPLAQSSLDAGYYDQSHLALEARQLGGASVLEMKSQAVPDAPWWALSTPRAMQGFAQELRP